MFAITGNAPASLLARLADWWRNLRQEHADLDRLRAGGNGIEEIARERRAIGFRALRRCPQGPRRQRFAARSALRASHQSEETLACAAGGDAGSGEGLLAVRQQALLRARTCERSGRSALARILSQRADDRCARGCARGPHLAPMTLRLKRDEHDHSRAMQ
jgi:hypothetical protein